MDQLTRQQLCDILEHYIKSKKSNIAARRFAQREFNVTLNRQQILRLYKQFRKCCFNPDHLARRKGLAGRPKVQTTPTKINRVHASVRQSPKKSLRRRSLSLNIPQTTLRRMLKNLQLRPYVFREGQELKPEDYFARVEMCTWFLQQIDQIPYFLDKLLITDEAKFYMNGTVTSSHVRIWAAARPLEIQEKSMDQRGVMVWCGLTSRHVIGPFFFDANVNQQTYQAMLRDKVWVALNNLGYNVAELWFQQDGAPAHTANATLAMLEQKFEERVISKRAEVEWAPRSPDLSACDYFAWGFVKQLVYAEKPRDLDDLKRKIEEKFEQLSPAMLQKVFWQNFPRRLQACIDNGGGHVE
jgi:hypothetical protein